MTGDFIVDLRNIDSNNNIRNYANTLLRCSCKCLINRPTAQSSYTFIEHIYTSNLKFRTTYGILINNFSEYFSIFVGLGHKNDLKIKFMYSEYKSYRNHLNRLIHAARQSYFHQYQEQGWANF